MNPKCSLNSYLRSFLNVLKKERRLNRKDSALNFKLSKEGKIMEKQLNWKCSAIHFTSAALMAVTIAYASVFLLEKGFLNSTIGAVLAVSSLAFYRNSNNFSRLY
jgi:hypothetical protein